MLYDPKWEKPSTVTPESPREVLLSAARLIEIHGLAKETQRDAEGRLCLMGAISVARMGATCKYDSVTCRATLAVHKYLLSVGVSEDITAPSGSAQWNNQPQRTQTEVVAALRGAAQMC